MKKESKKTLYKNQNKDAGQSIIEILLATFVVAMVLTALASGLTVSLKNTSETRTREQATSLAQEGLEVFHKERSNLGWRSFWEAARRGERYCLNQLPANTQAFTQMTIGDCAENSYIAGTRLTRSARVTTPGGSSNNVRIFVDVTWHDGKREQTVTVGQLFQNIE